ncbi:alpha/beta hydrolase [Streptomyces sp. NPDC046215]|uniref:Lipase n=1 Tax=Streptomyces stramineus TaxID=173861 RepID=A0ABN1AKK4_9ACTN
MSATRDDRARDDRAGVDRAGVDRRTVAKSAAALAGLLLLDGTRTAQARTAGGVTVRLPAPTGPHRLGVTTLHLVDRHRRDPWDSAIPVREVMVTVFYPAGAVAGFPVAPQMTADAAASFLETGHRVRRELPETGVNWAATVTHAHAGAPARPVPRPVLLYSPGGGDPRTLGTGTAEELASHGYVVVTIDHPGDAGEVDFPGATAYREKVRQTVFRGDPRPHADFFRTAIETRVADTRFVLDRLESLAAGRNPDAAGRALPKHLGRALDLRRVGAYGHSAGGTTVAAALYEDRRIDAAVTMEGYLDHTPAVPGRAGELFPIAEHGADRPLLLLGSGDFSDRQALERSWAPVLARSRGRAHRRVLDGAAHWVFSDYAATAPQLQTAGLMSAEARTALVGKLAPRTSIPAVRGAVRAFFDRHLRVC